MSITGQGRQILEDSSYLIISDSKERKEKEGTNKMVD